MGEPLSEEKLKIITESLHEYGAKLKERGMSDKKVEAVLNKILKEVVNEKTPTGITNIEKTPNLPKPQKER